MTDRPLVEMDGDRKIYNLTLPGGVEISVPANEIPEDAWNETVARGLADALMSKGMSKIKPGITKLEGKALEDRRAELFEQAEKNKAALIAGTLFKKKAKEKKGELQTVAIRLAKVVAANLVRAHGYNFSKWKASEQTAAAKKVLEQQPEIYDEARAEIAKVAERSKAVVMDMSALGLAISDDKKAKPRKGKTSTKAEGQLSAKQAGLVAPQGTRQRPGAAVH